MAKAIKTANPAARHWASSMKSFFKGTPAPAANSMPKISDTPHIPCDADIALEMAELTSVYDKFAHRFAHVTNSITAQFRAAQKENATLRSKTETLARDWEKNKGELITAKSRGDSLQTAYDQARAAASSATTKLDRAVAELNDTKEHLSAARHRNETLSNDYARVLHDFDNLQTEVITARVELSDTAALCEQLKVQLEQSRRKESDLNARMQLISVEVENYRFEVDRTYQEVGQRSERVSNLESDLSSLRAGLSNIEAERDAFRAERDRLSAEKEKLAAEIENISTTSDAKIEGLSKAKAFLATTLESVRKQANEHLRRISQLEQSNLALSRILHSSDAHPDAEPSAGDIAQGGIVTNEKVVKMTG